MEKISVTIITLNEEKMIGGCLDSLKWADEIVVIDSFSSDKTVEICRQYTDKVFQQPFPGHIEQKNLAIDKTANDWVLSLDADERVSTVLGDNIKKELQNGPGADGYFIARRSHYLGRWINHSGWYPNSNVRFFRKEKGRWGGINPHDSITVDGKTGAIDGDILHFPYRDIAHNISTINNFTDILAREMYDRGKRANLFDLALRPHLTFFKKYVLNKGFLDGIPGFIICSLTAYYVFFKYAKLWNKTRDEGLL